jgi:lipoprotein-anchoring transpeptidase ErfK/SrfK
MQAYLKIAAITFSLLMLSACGFNDAGNDSAQQQVPRSDAKDVSGVDAMASRDPGPGEMAENATPDADPRPIMQAQVVLERLGFGPGVIDGKSGVALVNALKGFQESRDLDVTGELDEATRQALARWNNIPATRVITIPQSWKDIKFVAVPDDAAQQAEMTHLGYENMAEALAERFHTTPEVLAQLNPGGRPAAPKTRPAPSASGVSAQSGAAPASAAPIVYSAGQQLRVPNVGADQIDASQVDNKGWLATLRSLGVGTQQPSVAKVIVDESAAWLKAYDKNDKIVAMFTVTTGSKNDPLPLGNWQIKGVAYNPPFAYNPKLFWDVPDTEEKQRIPSGPNGPVGVVWIDLSKDHYGIHGTPAPETIGRAQSHGCVRLNNWDAARLAQMVSPGTKVVFQK